MDQGGTEVCIVSFVGLGIQAIPNSNQAGEVTRHANYHLAEIIAKSPKRLEVSPHWRSRTPTLLLRN
jgi:hypothetical protein